MFLDQMGNVVQAMDWAAGGHRRKIDYRPLQPRVDFSTTKSVEASGVAMGTRLPLEKATAWNCDDQFKPPAAS